MDTYPIFSLDLLKSIVVGFRSKRILFMVEGPYHIYFYLLVYLILELRLVHCKMFKHMYFLAVILTVVVVSGIFTWSSMRIVKNM
jgi:hypothetical protein